MHPSTQFDVIIIGAGIAGISAAAELSRGAKVLVLETEPQPGQHATGRSAAYFAPSYGNEVIRTLTAMSADSYLIPNETFKTEVIKPRYALFVAQDPQQESIEAMRAEQPGLNFLNTQQLQQAVPILTDKIRNGLLDETGGDLDVDAIMQGYLSEVRKNANIISTNSEVLSLNYVDHWQIYTKNEIYHAPLIINAGGAWADEIAMRAGIGALDLTPMKRTAMLIDPPLTPGIEQWPLVVDVDESFYFKPDAGKLLLSPADETPTPASDAFPDELDIAIAVDRISNISSLEVSSVTHSWAGLRTFASDRTPVIGFDPRAKGFFWLAGQGGYGVQTAPGIARLTGQLCLDQQLDQEFESIVASVAPDRLI